jgi:hypothetical protein
MPQRAFPGDEVLERWTEAGSGQSLERILVAHIDKGGVELSTHTKSDSGDWLPDGQAIQLSPSTIARLRELTG